MPHLFLLALLTSAKILLKKDIDNAHADAEAEVLEPANVRSTYASDMAGDRIVPAARLNARNKGNIRLPWPLLG